MENNKQALVKAVGLTKVFRDFWGRPKAKAVNDIDFEIKEGEIVGLLGPNGSGKSTTVKMILGLLYPTGGQLSVLGKSPRAVETKREIGYLPEESYLYKYLTAEETLDFFGSLFNLSAGERKSRIDQLLDMVGMAHARHRRVGEFSKGMQRRIGLAQAMINDPSFLILDEPTSGLDPLGSKEVKDLILTLKKRGKTVLMTSHLLSDVEDVCDRVIILYGGKIRAEGSIRELLTVEDSTTVTAPTLNVEQTAKFLEILRKEFGDGNFAVSHPRRTLEDFFLDVVNRAKQESVETAGVVGGGEVANYLKGENAPKDAVLAALIEEARPVTPAAAAPAPVAAPTVEPEAEAAKVEEKLSDLMSEKRVEVVPQSAPQSAMDAESLAKANEKLGSLLGGGADQTQDKGE
ncbi:MAG: ABC transporter ATP-binding protein [Victivallaceae bacterium]|nr:ABC transporter ATP-binding protein [Victivallaceae bacterium]